MAGKPRQKQEIVSLFSSRIWVYIKLLSPRSDFIYKVSNMAEYKQISVKDIILIGNNPRQIFDEAKLRDLGKSMLEDGQLQEIWVRPKGDKFELVTGERRFRAARLVGIRNIRARVEDVDDARLMEIRLLENTQREDLTEAEKGNAIAHLLGKYPEKYPTIGSLAKKIKKSESTINRWLLQSERLTDFVKKSIQLRRISAQGVRYLVSFPHEEQNKLVKAIIKYEVKKGHNDRHVEFIKRYQLSFEKYPTVESLEALANEIKGVKKINIDLSKLSPEAKAEVEKTLEEAKEEAKKRRAKRPKKPRRKIRRQGRPPKEEPTPKPTEPEERKPLPPLVPTEVKSITMALNFPIPLWEKITRYQAQEQILLEEAIISLLEIHPLLQGV